MGQQKVVCLLPSALTYFAVIFLRKQHSKPHQSWLPTTLHNLVLTYLDLTSKFRVHTHLALACSLGLWLIFWNYLEPTVLEQVLPWIFFFTCKDLIQNNLKRACKSVHRYTNNRSMCLFFFYLDLKKERERKAQPNIIKPNCFAARKPFWLTTGGFAFPRVVEVGLPVFHNRTNCRSWEQRCAALQSVANWWQWNTRFLCFCLLGRGETQGLDYMPHWPTLWHPRP